MSLAAALILAASTAFASPAVAPGGGAGAQVTSARASVTIVKAVIVRQASGLQQDPDAPVPQIRRRGRTVLFEFQ